MSIHQALRVVDAWLKGNAGRPPVDGKDRARYNRERDQLNAALLRLKRAVEDPDQ